MDVLLLMVQDFKKGDATPLLRKVGFPLVNTFARSEFSHRI